MSLGICNAIDQNATGRNWLFFLINIGYSIALLRRERKMNIQKLKAIIPKIYMTTARLNRIVINFSF